MGRAAERRCGGACSPDTGAAVGCGWERVAGEKETGGKCKHSRQLGGRAGASKRGDTGPALRSGVVCTMVCGEVGQQGGVGRRQGGAADAPPSKNMNG